MAPPLVVLDNVCRDYATGAEPVVALRDVTLTIAAGEMVAIVGASGSGKSTLLNILGCLDRPTGGSYRVLGRETAALEADELAALRREHFGFIFQRYHLMAELTAAGNVEMPAVYAGLTLQARQARAAALLARLGMAGRASHRPGQLSGGQQQRVSIARALMNGAEVIFADEPTGALDSASGREVLRILDELHAGGQTVIIVTHDMAVARRAERIIELRDGVVVSDRPNRRETPAEAAPAPAPAGPDRAAIVPATPWRARLDHFREAFRMALLSMNAHRLRTVLTMLGIVIGVASVVCVVALGAGSQQKVLANINNLGTNTLEVFPGKDFGDVRSGKVTTLVVADAQALAGQPYVAAVTPTVSTSKTLRSGSIEVTAQVNGVGEAYFAVKGTELAEGAFFDADGVRRIAQDVVIDANTRKALFGETATSPVGRIILVGAVPCRIVGVTRPQQGGFGSSANPSVYLPYTTVQARFLGSTSLRSISVRVDDDASTDLAEQAVTALLVRRHKARDFFILNTDDIRRTITSTTQALTLLVAAIAAISLVVGGVGVTNIMLVSVSERIAEIGVRMAVGARRSDILQQFLIEAVLVCLIGGLTGIGLALGFGALFNAASTAFSLHYSLTSIIVAFLSSTLIGVVFGYMPARNASRLDPVAALARE
ncbi:MacB family efflux pump subunit [Labrys wisconsinensis]|uniref:Pyoverdine export ATP-binding/permease protein PvdT n=1 Tax=Labrys wisconsinensis TaxID=425677 RepID=A0ABU0JE79_9HYPH|nr:MacB family efflux pump subunit [Labrys wisconsinensis]MDQ0471584.1 macrolide transport system ATP-binding/permease protein [Labrys wisconsinensis]